LRSVATFSPSESEMGFEFGIADGVEFNYLDEEELHRLLPSIVREAPQTLDLFCVLRYHIIKAGKRVPLKFDYYMLRFTFYDKNNVELRVSHQRGIRRVSAEEIITFMTKRINEELSQNRLRPLELKNLRAP